MRYPARERKWVREILVRLTPEQRARYEQECKNDRLLRHRNGKLYDEARARIAERILLEDAKRRS